LPALTRRVGARGALLVVCGQGEDRQLVAIERFHQRRPDHVEGIVGLLATRG
jgi:hypothetical protein